MAINVVETLTSGHRLLKSSLTVRYRRPGIVKAVGYFSVPDALVTVTAFFHIVSAMGWLGGHPPCQAGLEAPALKIDQSLGVSFFAVLALVES